MVVIILDSFSIAFPHFGSVRLTHGSGAGPHPASPAGAVWWCYGIVDNPGALHPRTQRPLQRRETTNQGAPQNGKSGSTRRAESRVYPTPRSDGTANRASRTNSRGPRADHTRREM